MEPSAKGRRLWHVNQTPCGWYQPAEFSKRGTPVVRLQMHKVGWIQAQVTSLMLEMKYSAYKPQANIWAAELAFLSLWCKLNEKTLHAKLHPCLITVVGITISLSSPRCRWGPCCFRLYTSTADWFLPEACAHLALHGNVIKLWSKSEKSCPIQESQVVICTRFGDHVFQFLL